jgi:hypothetical protein
MRSIRRKSLSYADEANLALIAKTPHRRHQFLFCKDVIFRLNAMKMIDIDIVGAD